MQTILKTYIEKKPSLLSGDILPLNSSTVRKVDDIISSGPQFRSEKTFLGNDNSIFLPADLSKMVKILPNTDTQIWVVLSQDDVPFNLTNTPPSLCLICNEVPTIEFEPPTLVFSECNKMKYEDGGKPYEWCGSQSEKHNFESEISNEWQYPYIERSDVTGFDFIQVTPRGTRKIPLVCSADTLCGPLSYTGYTYDRINYTWFFGGNAGIDFNFIESGATPVAISGAVTSQEGCAAVCDQEGAILFYTDGETVYTKENTQMSNGFGLSSSGTSTQSAIIIPQPGSNKYYIFTTDFNGNPNGFEYSIVDMSLQGGLGQVGPKNISLIGTPLSEKVTAVCDGDDYWVITHTSGDSTFYSYKITSTGVSPAVTTTIGSVHNTARGYMKATPNGEKLISCLYDEDIIDIFDLNVTAGTLSNFITLTGFTYDIGPYGVEFSSDSSKFYISEGAGDKIYQFDLTYSGATDIIDNVIELPTISGSSFTGATVSGASIGALQMGPDEKIYVADLNKPYLHVIHHPNGEGIQCNLQQKDFNLTATTNSGVTSQWGLPNVIPCKALSCDRYVYVTSKGRVQFNFDFVFNNYNDLVENKNLDYTGEIYKYDQTLGIFTDTALDTFTVDNEALKSSNTHTIGIPLSKIPDDGEYIFKSYYSYDIDTWLAKQLGIRKDSINSYKKGKIYGLYDPLTDWYFVNVYEAYRPLFSNSTPLPPAGINRLIVESVFTESDRTDYNINTESDALVSYNGAVLMKNVEYSAITSGLTPFIRLLFTPLDDQVLTWAYVDNGEVGDIFLDSFQITDTINSGPTGSQSNTDRVYFNTDHSTYEIYTLSTPASDVLLNINGDPLFTNNEYFMSTTDSKRVILKSGISLSVGYVIQLYYVPMANPIGNVFSNRFDVSWSVPTTPLTNNGKFTLQFTSPSDIDFDNILYSFTVDYDTTLNVYKIEVFLDGAEVGDEFIYRVLNEKWYEPIMCEEVYTYSYSIDTPRIKIMTNTGESY